MIQKQTTIILLLFISILFNPLSGQNSLSPDAYLNIAEAYKSKQVPDSALVYYSLAAAAFESENKVEKSIDVYNQMGILLTRQDKYPQALEYLNKALALGQKYPEKHPLGIATTYISFGVVFNAQNQFDLSLEHHFKALKIREDILGPDHEDVATSYGNIGNVQRNNGEFDLSIEAHRKAMSIREKIFGAESPQIVESYVGLGRAFKEKKDYTKALDYFQKALKNKKLQFGDSAKDLSRFHKYISDTYYAMGDTEMMFSKNKAGDPITASTLSKAGTLVFTASMNACASLAVLFIFQLPAIIGLRNILTP